MEFDLFELNSDSDTYVYHSMSNVVERCSAAKLLFKLECLSVCLAQWVRPNSERRKQRSCRAAIKFSVASSSDEHKLLQLTSASRFSDTDTEVAGYLQDACVPLSERLWAN